MPPDPRRKYERSQVIWLLLSYAIIAVMAGSIMLYGALQAGLVRQRAEQWPPCVRKVHKTYPDAARNSLFNRCQNVLESAANIPRLLATARP
jgi:hypothetical protein